MTVWRVELMDISEQWASSSFVMIILASAASLSSVLFVLPAISLLSAKWNAAQVSWNQVTDLVQNNLFPDLKNK